MPFSVARNAARARRFEHLSQFPQQATADYPSIEIASSWTASGAKATPTKLGRSSADITVSGRWDRTTSAGPAAQQVAHRHRVPAPAAGGRHPALVQRIRDPAECPNTGGPNAF